MMVTVAEARQHIVCMHGRVASTKFPLNLVKTRWLVTPVSRKCCILRGGGGEKGSPVRETNHRNLNNRLIRNDNDLQGRFLKRVN